MVRFDDEIEALIQKVIGAAIEVHRVLGPGYPESVYERALCHELQLQGITHRRQVDFDVEYKGAIVGSGRIDLLVEERLIVELKAVTELPAVFKQQVVAYLKSRSENVGLLLNFNVIKLNDGGIHRIIFTK
ncbi:MAG: GxxExxY protein [Planctomycetes bacterium]|nr:GxxExxY protein [Planctomycetota bacterium]MCB9935444.1 GxxExxY protein [Planctomycetota bacterium]